MTYARCTPWFNPDDLACDASSAAASAAPLIATDWVYHSTGSRWPGVCQTRVRPMLPCGHLTQCACGSRWERLDLTRWVRGPVTGLDAVTVNGVDLSPVADHARIDLFRYLTPIRDGELWPWPSQDVNVDEGDPRTWSVEVTHGALPPLPVIDAAMKLACQLVKRAATGTCDLPDNATSVSDNGVTINLDIPANGRTGIPGIDSVLDVYGQGRRQSRIYNPMAEPAPTTALS